MNGALATPPTDVFWALGSCILFQLDFPLQAEESQIRGQCGWRGRFRGQSNSNGRDVRAAERDADVENEPAGIPAGESMFITEIWQIVTEACKIRTPCEWAEIGR
jgi:hypothetical protein